MALLYLILLGQAEKAIILVSQMRRVKLTSDSAVARKGAFLRTFLVGISKRKYLCDDFSRR
jgi:hypothetical protein